MSKTNDERDELIKDLETQVNTMCDRLCEIAKALEVETQDASPLEIADKCCARAAELIRALQMAWLLLNTSELPNPEDNND